MSFTLAVCSEMVFTDLPLLERVRRIHDAGFAVEIWDWSTKDADALVATGARFTSMTGYLSGDLVTGPRSRQAPRAPPGSRSRSRRRSTARRSTCTAPASARAGCRSCRSRS